MSASNITVPSFKNRDPGIELARLLGCLIIIAVHTRPGYFAADGSILFDRLFLACVLSDGVGIFWLISGCFLFRNTYRKALKTAFFKVFIPLVLASLFGILVNVWIRPECIANDFARAPGLLIQGVNFVSGMEHLWYLYVYLCLLILYPVLKAIVKWLDKSLSRSLWFVLGVLAVFVVNDFTSNHLANFGHAPIHGVIPAGLLLICGHILYKYRKPLIHKHMAWLWAGIFLGVNLVRAMVLIPVLKADPNNVHLLFWFSGFGMISEICVLFFAMSLRSSPVSASAFSTGLNNLIVTLGSYTFAIYIVHFPMIYMLGKLGFPTQGVLQLMFHEGSLASTLAYSFLMTAVTFLASLLFAILIQGLWKLIRMVWDVFRKPEMAVSARTNA